MRNPALITHLAATQLTWEGAVFVPSSEITLRDLAALVAMHALMLNTPRDVPRDEMRETTIGMLATRQADAQLAALEESSP